MPAQRDVALRFADRAFPEPNSGCWLWDGAWNGKGYGVVCNTGGERQTHRLSWLLHRGAIPDGKMVLHRCDVPCCVNPDHLFLGVAKDNTRDMMRKGRHKPRIKLTPDQVRHVRACDLGSSELATLYGVKINTITRIRAGVRQGGVV